MSDKAIIVENLSKRYRIGLKEKMHETLGGAAAAWFKEPVANLKRLRGLTRFETDQDNASDVIWALKDISFEVKQGEAVGIIGANGAGKSTLLKIISRIVEPTSGRAILNGRVSSLLEIGTGFHPELTGRENVYLNGVILGMSKAEIDRKFDEIVDFSGVEKFLDTPVKRYSSGMGVRLAFAVAAHLETDILIVDEVLAVGDIEFQKKCIGKMDRTAHEGRTVLFVSHNMGVINALCNTCILLKKGEIVCRGSTQKVISQYTQTTHKEAVVEIKPALRNRGNGQVVFRRCVISNNDNEFKNSFLIGEDIVINIFMDIQLAGDIYFWLIFMDSEGKPILSSHQGDIGTVKVAPGQYKLECKTIDLGLMPGNYSITAGAFDKSRTFLEWIDNCQHFEVLNAFENGKPYDSRWGLVNQKVEWKLQKDNG